jgi:hypothetical protein
MGEIDDALDELLDLGLLHGIIGKMGKSSQKMGKIDELLDLG